MRNRKGNIILVFVFLVGFLGVVLAYGYLITGNLRSAGARRDTFAAFYTAEAGLQKAIWNLNTPVEMGGQGTSWRTTGLIEAYGSGSYQIKVQGTPSGLIIITSEGSVGDSKRKVQLSLQASGLPPAFDYAMFNNGGLTIMGNARIQGDLFSNGNVVVKNPATSTGGSVYYSSGYGVSGTGTYTNGGTPATLPTMPVLDSSYYISEIAVTKSSNPSVLHGNQVFTDYDFGGRTIYVDGDVTISGNSIGVGAAIVSSGKISFSGSLSGPVSLYASKEVAASGNISTSSILYGGDKITSSGVSVIYGTLLSSDVKISGTTTIYGVIYSWNLGIDLLGTVNIYGSVVNPSSQTYNGSILIVHSPTYIPSYIPGMSAGGINIVPHSWKEI